MTTRHILRGTIIALAMSVALSTTALANGHLASEREGETPETKPAKIIVISPTDHVMLVGGSRRLDAQICNEDASGCKDAGRKAKWSVAPKKGLAAKPNKGPSSLVTGRQPGAYTVTVKQGNATGSTTVTVNEPPDREPVAEAPEMRLLSVPEHPIVADGHPYSMDFYLCPRGVTIESVLEQAAGYGFIASDEEAGPPDIGVAAVGERLVAAGCEPAELALLEPEEGFEVVYQRGNQVLLYKQEGAAGFSVRFVSESGEAIFPSDKAAYFGADSVDVSDLPGLEGVDIAALDREYLEGFGIDEFERFDVNGDGVLSMADVLRYREYSQRLEEDEAGEISLDDEDEELIEGMLDIDGDGKPDTADDEELLTRGIGELLLDLLRFETPAAC